MIIPIELDAPGVEIGNRIHRFDRCMCVNSFVGDNGAIQDIVRLGAEIGFRHIHHLPAIHQLTRIGGTDDVLISPIHAVFDRLLLRRGESIGIEGQSWPDIDDFKCIEHRSLVIRYG